MPTGLDHSGLGGKASGLLLLREHYAELIPPFVVLPLSAVIRDWAGVEEAVSALLRAHLALPMLAAEYDKRAAAIAATLRLNDIAISATLDPHRAALGERVSYRSSALAEDGATDSFAGQFETALDKRTDATTIEVEVLACIRSMFSMRVAEYARLKGRTELDFGGSVVVQRMFEGRTTGVLFSENGRAEITLAWSESARNTTVEGEDAEQLTASKLSDWPPARELPAPQRLLDIAVECERMLGAPVDIEWAARGTELALLQLRPQTVAGLDYEIAWDCSNIAENYPGVTLPLSYSFIRGVYARVYPEFFRLLGVRQRTLERKKSVFGNTLGYLDGHVFYQIDNWFEMVRLIPGPRSNQRFFEAMLQPARGGAAPRARLGLGGALGMAPLVGRLGWLMLRSNALSKRFSRRFTERLRRFERLDWEHLDAATILTEFERIRTELLTMWATPVFNDLRVMIFHGLLKQYSFGSERHADYLGYLHGLSDRASIAPIRALGELGVALHGRHPEAQDAAELMASPNWQASRALVEGYLARFGGRAPDELQLENPRLGDDIAALVTLALGAVSRGDSGAGGVPVAVPPRTARGRFGTRWIGHNARQAIDWRERFRFNRAQVYGVARTAYLALGSRLVEAGLLDRAHDVFWLSEEQLDATVFGHGWDRELRPIVERRRAELAEFESVTPARRMVGNGRIAPRTVRADMVATEGDLAGQGVAPGVLTAPVVVLHEFDPTVDVHGKILVTSHIDPGWTLLFVQAAGVITERGNALSHVAIISRELGLPAVVAAVGAVDALRTGMRVTIDGTSGTISLADFGEQS